MVKYASLVNNFVVGFVTTTGQQPINSIPVDASVEIGDVWNEVTQQFSTPDISSDTNITLLKLSELVVVDDFATPIVYENSAYQPSKNQHFTITTDILNDANEVQSAINASGLKLVCSRVSNGQLTGDESLLKCTIVNGVMTLDGEFERSGVWLISVDYNNKKLKNLGFNFAIDNPDIEFWI